MSALAALALIPPPPGDRVVIGPLTVHYYGIAIAIGALLAVTLLRRRYAARGGDPDLADRTAVWGVAAGLLGARLAYVSTHLDRFIDRPWAVVAIWEGGLAFFGGLTLGALTAIWYVRRNGARVADFVDAAAPALPLAHAIGRWGNYFNEELYGTPTSLPWGLRVTREPFPVHPTFLYESLLNLLLAGALLWIDRKKDLKRGSLVFAYLTGYGVIRFGMELLRTDTTWRLFGLSRNAYVALAVVLIGVIGGKRWQRRPDDPADEAELAEAELAEAELAEAELAEAHAVTPATTGPAADMRSEPMTPTAEAPTAEAATEAATEAAQESASPAIDEPAPEPAGLDAAESEPADLSWTVPPAKQDNPAPGTAPAPTEGGADGIGDDHPQQPPAGQS